MISEEAHLRRADACVDDCRILKRCEVSHAKKSRPHPRKTAALADRLDHENVNHVLGGNALILAPGSEHITDLTLVVVSEVVGDRLFEFVELDAVANLVAVAERLKVRRIERDRINELEREAMRKIL